MTIIPHQLHPQWIHNSLSCQTPEDLLLLAARFCNLLGEVLPIQHSMFSDVLLLCFYSLEFHSVFWLILNWLLHMVWCWVLKLFPNGESVIPKSFIECSMLSIDLKCHLYHKPNCHLYNDSFFCTTYLISLIHLSISVLILYCFNYYDILGCLIFLFS